MDGPEDSEVVAPDLVEGKPSGQSLPEYNAPAEDITFLRVSIAY